MAADSTTEPAVDLTGVGKRYRLAERSLVQAMRPSKRRAVRDLWAVRDLDLRIEPGETVGLLGRNGAGKSTLLRMMAGVSEPTEGRVVVRGRIAPLISVGVGFHQELTGRENVYVNGMLLGLSRAQVEERFDEIVAFAELTERIDTPVKFYSSGMFMRLGFSVAIHVNPEVLLVDEVLAVGDVAFQLKCFDRMRELSAGGTTIVLVSALDARHPAPVPRACCSAGAAGLYDGPEFRGHRGAPPAPRRRGPVRRGQRRRAGGDR
ncbi:MAG: ABC transporter ATP-binding protein [Acidimicrobiia bacterium]|nr:ABC transporter ATP-binding protein [Acidimicrobiia bacterium]